MPQGVDPSQRPSLLSVALVTSVIKLLLVWPFADMSLGGDHYLQLAWRFSQGRLDVDHLTPQYRDYVPWNGHKYLPFGPLPAILLVPVVALFGTGVPLVFANYFFGIINVAVLWGLMARLGVQGERRVWITLLFFGGTPYLSITLGGISTYFAHVVTTTFLLLALLEFHGKRRLTLVGLLVGLAAASRMTALFSLAYFLWLASAPPAGGDRRMGSRLRGLLYIGLGIAGPLSLLALYNYLRFGNPAESGFGLALLYSSVLEDARSVGLFSIAHVPKNLYAMLLAGPRPFGGEEAAVLRFPFLTPSPWGMGLFFTSPALLYAFRARMEPRAATACVLAIICTAIPIISYYGIGFVQFGYRYALDFMPFVILLVASVIPQPVSRAARALIAASVVINIWGAISLAIWI